MDCAQEGRIRLEASELESPAVVRWVLQAATVGTVH